MGKKTCPRPRLAPPPHDVDNEAARRQACGVSTVMRCYTKEGSHDRAVSLSARACWQTSPRRTVSTARKCERCGFQVWEASPHTHTPTGYSEDRRCCTVHCAP